MNEGNSFRFDLWLYNELVKRGWTGADLARKTGLSKVTIGQYLGNDRMPNLRTFALILDAFGKHLVIEDN